MGRAGGSGSDVRRQPPGNGVLDAVLWWSIGIAGAIKQRGGDEFEKKSWALVGLVMGGLRCTAGRK